MCLLLILLIVVLLLVIWYVFFRKENYKRGNNLANKLQNWWKKFLRNERNWWRKITKKNPPSHDPKPNGWCACDSNDNITQNNCINVTYPKCAYGFCRCFSYPFPP